VTCGAAFTAADFLAATTAFLTGGAAFFGGAVFFAGLATVAVGVAAFFYGRHGNLFRGFGGGQPARAGPIRTTHSLYHAWPRR
jgi:hypothetical protein